MENLMIHLSSKRIRNLVGLILAIYIVLIVFNLITPFLYSNQVKMFIKNDQDLGWAVFILLYTIAKIFPVVPDFPLQVIAISLFGVANTIAVTYFLCVATSAIPFFIARFIGKNFVARLIGKDRFEKVNIFSKYLKTRELIIARIFEVSVFEWISYASGFSDISFAKYIGITALFSLPYFIIVFILASLIPNLGGLYVAVSAVGYAAALIPIPYFLKKRKQKQ